MKLSSSLLLATSLAIAPLHADAPVRVQGVPIVSRVFKAAALDLRQMGIELKIEEDCGNTQALAALSKGEIDVALLGRPLTPEDRANNPSFPLDEMKIGTQTLAILVSKPIWDSGVRALKREQMIELYEGRADTWKRFGGEERTTKFFEPAHGQGIWEMFANWLYGDARKAPAVPWEVVASGADAQNAVQFYSGAASVAAIRWADNKEVFPISIINDAGEAVAPTAANVEANKYPLTRPAYVILAGRPSGNRRKLLEYLRSEKGRAAISGSDLLPVEEAAPSK